MTGAGAGSGIDGVAAITGSGARSIVMFGSAEASA
jgi:hypothetical protein